ncbi:SDR family NAD(P)-dependent oxidoreductase [Terrihalobacillus insolitus]|uniref:SDR family NAD(P)-dependent oxidoreductase n=1 Tax=Terrihalobacillus insolitus TaxID=2950438 RepID=UPI0023417930|nr:glucose 1-dehydrogenase [Terrihalobacillus insolitus]MDC3415155.1 glucose 1-dehydrogenase [Terrihalobacillus insolitus]
MRLENKVALITGAGSGIGKESAKLFAKEGATVVVNDVNHETGQETVDEIIAGNGKALFLHGDVTNENDVKDFVGKIVENYNKIDVLLNNAGISGVGMLHEVDLETWDRVMNINVKGVFLVLKYVIPQMMKQESGSIINMSSSIAEIGVQDRAVYTASKGAVLSLTKSIQVDYSKYNIRANALLPGTIYTPFVENYVSKSQDPEKTVASIKSRQLSNELGKPIDVAYAALYLASDESKFVMGTPFIVDGGIINGKKS